MEAILTLFLVVLFLVAVTTLGTDSRDGNDWIRHSRP